jgi:hypothetical protein
MPTPECFDALPIPRGSVTRFIVLGLFTGDASARCDQTAGGRLGGERLMRSLIALLAFVSLTTEIAPLWAKQKRQLTDEEIQAAYSVAVNQVSKILKAPLTAVYPPIEEVKFSPAIRKSIDVRFYVDSQNSFGALLRTRIFCNVGPQRPDGLFKVFCLDQRR